MSLMSQAIGDPGVAPVRSAFARAVVFDAVERRAQTVFDRSWMMSSLTIGGHHGIGCLRAIIGVASIAAFVELALENTALCALREAHAG